MVVTASTRRGVRRALVRVLSFKQTSPAELKKNQQRENTRAWRTPIESFPYKQEYSLKQRSPSWFSKLLSGNLYRAFFYAIVCSPALNIKKITIKKLLKLQAEVVKLFKLVKPWGVSMVW